MCVSQVVSEPAYCSKLGNSRFPRWRCIVKVEQNPQASIIKLAS